MEQKFKEVFKKAVLIAMDKDYVEDLIIFDDAFKTEYTDDNGHWDYDRLWSDADFYLNKILGEE